MHAVCEPMQTCSSPGLPCRVALDERRVNGPKCDGAYAVLHPQYARIP